MEYKISKELFEAVMDEKVTTEISISPYYKEIIIDGIEYRLVPICRATEPKYYIEATFNDWRLPTIQELKTLVNYNKYDTACDLEDTISNFYWSNSPSVSDSSGVWHVDFGDGDDGWFDKSFSALVRCVRDGKQGLEWSATSENTMIYNEAIEYAKNLVAPVYYKDKQ